VPAQPKETQMEGSTSWNGNTFNVVMGQNRELGTPKVGMRMFAFFHPRLLPL